MVEIHRSIPDHDQIGKQCVDLVSFDLAEHGFQVGFNRVTETHLEPKFANTVWPYSGLHQLWILK